MEKVEKKKTTEKDDASWLLKWRREDSIRNREEGQMKMLTPTGPISTPHCLPEDLTEESESRTDLGASRE